MNTTLKRARKDGETKPSKRQRVLPDVSEMKAKELQNFCTELFAAIKEQPKLASAFSSIYEQEQRPKVEITEVTTKTTKLTGTMDLYNLRQKFIEGKFSAKEVNNICSEAFETINYKGKSLLYTVIYNLQEKAQAIQREFEGQGEDDEDSSVDDAHYRDDELVAFPSSVDIAVYYDMKKDEIIGPLSLACCGVGKKKMRKLNKRHPSTRRAIDDFTKMEEMRSKEHILCIYSK